MFLFRGEAPVQTDHSTDSVLHASSLVLQLFLVLSLMNNTLLS